MHEENKNITTRQVTALVIPQLSDENPLRLQQVLSPLLSPELSLEQCHLLLEGVDVSACVALLL